MKRQSKLSKVINSKLFICLQIIASIIFTFLVWNLGVLPMLYFIVLIAVLLIFIGITLWVRNKKSTARSYTSSLFSIVISILLVFGSMMALDGSNFLDTINSNMIDKQNISVITLRKSSIKKLKDLKNIPLGITEESQEEVAYQGVALISDELETEVKTNDYDTIEDMVNALYDEEEEAIVLNTALLSQAQKVKPNFLKECKIVYDIDIETMVSDLAKSAKVSEETFSIFISGHDFYDDSPKDEISKRSDVNMVVTVNPKNKQILLTSIPRDAYVPLGTKKGSDKITHASNFGVNESIKTIEKLFDMEINYSFEVNFSSLINIVDALDGVMVDNPTEFTAHRDSSSRDGKKYHFNKGEIELNGKYALVYCRERTVLAGGDFARGENQQRVIKGIVDKATSPKIITNYKSLLKSLEKTFKTNMPSKDIVSMIRMQLSDMSSWDIQSLQLTGEPGRSDQCYTAKGNLSVIFPHKKSVDKITKVISDMEKGNKISFEDKK